LIFLQDNPRSGIAEKDDAVRDGITAMRSKTGSELVDDFPTRFTALTEVNREADELLGQRLACDVGPGFRLPPELVDPDGGEVGGWGVRCSSLAFAARHGSVSLVQDLTE
jgi:hypothetical protein